MSRVRQRDAEAKEKAARYADARRGARQHQFKEGERVLMRQKRTNKWQTKFGSEPLTVTQVKGSMITARFRDGRETTRDASKFKSAKMPIEEGRREQSSSEEEDVTGPEEQASQGTESSTLATERETRGTESGTASEQQQRSVQGKSAELRRSTRERQAPARYTDTGKTKSK